VSHEEIERRPHPTHDRVTNRRFFAWALVAILCGLGFVTADSAGAGVWTFIGVIGFLAALVMVLRTPINRCHCPICEEPLRRPPDTIEFRCPTCAIVWTTTGYGWSILE
jgi:hypothetical protein